MCFYVVKLFHCCEYSIAMCKVRSRHGQFVLMSHVVTMPSILDRPQACFPNKTFNKSTPPFRPLFWFPFNTDFIPIQCDLQLLFLFVAIFAPFSQAPCWLALKPFFARQNYTLTSSIESEQHLWAYCEISIRPYLKFRSISFQITGLNPILLTLQLMA